MSERPRREGARSDRPEGGSAQQLEQLTLLVIRRAAKLLRPRGEEELRTYELARRWFWQ